MKVIEGSENSERDVKACASTWIKNKNANVRDGQRWGVTLETSRSGQMLRESLLFLNLTQ